ncbi:MAG: polysaccharide biosynthesis/export family protein [Myxococcaceae bacterium]
MVGRVRPRLLAKALPGALVLLVACASTGQYVWVKDYPEPPPVPDNGIVLVPGDIITIRVYNEPNMSTKTRVRNDGKVSLPFLNDVDAAGLTPVKLATSLQKRLKEYLNAPNVTVSLDEPRPYTIPVTGEVNKPGIFLLDPGAGLLAAIAAGGGLSPFASTDRIFVIRQLPAPARIRFSYKDLRDGDPKSVSFQLRQGDAVVVE